MAIKQCAACGQEFQCRPQVPHQIYCSAPQCQRERRRKWQTVKRRTDPDYRDNQARAQQAWNKRNPDYWREYRRSHPEYAERNRARQRERSTLSSIAKMDVSKSDLPLPSGIYRLSQVTKTGIAKIDVWTVEIIVLSCQSQPPMKIAKR